MTSTHSVFSSTPYCSSASTCFTYTKLLSDLHWLPVASRITYKTCSLIHSVLNHKQLTNLASLVTPYQPSRSLRSSDASLLTVPRTRLSLTSRSFAVASPSSWNSLPLSLFSNSCHTSFTKSLKTEIYRTAFVR